MSNETKSNEERILKVGSGTDAQKLASTIHSAYMENPDVPICLKSVGAGAVNQGIKATIIANKYFISKGLTIKIAPSFRDLPDENITAIEMRLRINRL